MWYHEVFLECVFPQLFLWFLACAYSALALKEKLFCDISAICILSNSPSQIFILHLLYTIMHFLYSVVQEVAHIFDKILCNLSCLVLLSSAIKAIYCICHFC